MDNVSFKDPATGWTISFNDPSKLWCFEHSDFGTNCFDDLEEIEKFMALHPELAELYRQAMNYE